MHTPICTLCIILIEFTQTILYVLNCTLLLFHSYLLFVKTLTNTNISPYNFHLIYYINSFFLLCHVWGMRSWLYKISFHLQYLINCFFDVHLTRFDMYMLISSVSLALNPLFGHQIFKNRFPYCLRQKFQLSNPDIKHNSPFCFIFFSGISSQLT